MKIESDYLSVEVDPLGAELKSVFSKKLNKEILWQGDEASWARRSPVLFPIIGRLKEDSYTYEGKEYELGQHGFLRDMIGEVYEEEGNLIGYEFLSNNETYKKYPFDFRVVIEYEVKLNVLIVRYIVSNLGDDTMYFSIGAHPGFNVNLEEDFIQLPEDEYVSYLALGRLINPETSLYQSDRIELKAENFINDAIVLEDCTEASIIAKDSDIIVRSKDFHWLGFWSKYDEVTGSIPKFICIEPWCGMTDFSDSSGNLKDKFGIEQIDANKSKEYSFEIEVLVK